MFSLWLRGNPQPRRIRTPPHFLPNHSQPSHVQCAPVLSIRHDLAFSYTHESLPLMSNAAHFEPFRLLGFPGPESARSHPAVATANFKNRSWFQGAYKNFDGPEGFG